MKYTTKAAEKSTVKITMTFTSEEWDAAINKAYLKLRGRFSVNGFRKGKAPRNVIEHAYGKGAFYEDALNLLFSEEYPKILDKKAKDFTVVGEPDVSVDDLNENGVVMSAVVPVKPEVKIEKYTGMKIRAYAYNVEDAEVDAEIERVRDRNARKVEVTDRAAQNGDIANIDFVGTVDGVKFDGGEAAGYELTLGSGTFIPGFEEQVVGMNVGESKDVNVKFPENYQAENLAGKDAVFAVKLNSLQGKELPELTDAFIKDATGSETVEEYKEKTKERLQKQADQRALNETENSILEAIAANATAEIPQAMIDAEIDNMVQKFEYQLMYQGLKLDDYLGFIKQTRAEFRKNYEEQAKKNVLSQLIISEIIKAEKIEATEEEVDAKIAEQAASVDKTAEEYKKTMDPRQVDYIRNDIIITKLFDFLKANNEMYVEESK
ncbi:MAG: trigger factor [Clostridia bacterium]|nr:trigger factor [Clostridia bacterium]